VLRQGGVEEGSMDGGGGPEARQLPPQQRPVLLARRAQACWCVTHPSLLLSGTVLVFMLAKTP
jgi:hypothetical protein